MKKKKHFSALILIISLFGVMIYTGLNQRNAYSYELIRYETGWGYEIKKDGHVVIRQEFIPGAAGKQVFSKKKDARIVAKRVMDKLQKGCMPTIKADELSELID